MVSRPQADLTELIAELARRLTERELPYMLIGGQAVLLHGRPRVTEDIDVTLGVGPTELPAVLDLCGALGLEPLPERVDEFVRDTYVLPARHPHTAMRVDFIFSTTPYEQQAIARAERIELGGCQVAFATAEDLMIHKLFAARPRDLEDAAGVVARKGHALDWEYLAHWAEQFAQVPGREEFPEQVARLKLKA